MPRPSKKNVDIVSKMRQLIQDELRSVYTASFCIVESVDSDSQRVEVSLKSDSEVFVGNVPIATPFATDNAGVVFPVESGDEGVLLHLREPITAQLQESGHVDIDSDRRFQLESAVFLPSVWLDSDEIPDHEEGELVIQHSTGTRIAMADDGSVTVEAESVTLGQPDSAAQVLTENAVIEYEDDGTTRTAEITDTGSEHTEAS